MLAEWVAWIARIARVATAAGAGSARVKLYDRFKVHITPEPLAADNVSR